MMRTKPLTSQEHEDLLAIIATFNAARKAADEAPTPEAHEKAAKQWEQCRARLCAAHTYVVRDAFHSQYVLGSLPPRLNEAEEAIACLNQAEADFADPSLRKDAHARFTSAWTYLMAQRIEFHRDLGEGCYKLDMEPVGGHASC